jgi:hypothetical protein
MNYLNLSNVLLPRKDDAHGYPLDLDGSLRFTRPYVIDPYPYPTIIGMISGFMRETNQFIWQQPARTPYGPNVNNLPTYAEYQIAVPGLTKLVK